MMCNKNIDIGVSEKSVISRLKINILKTYNHQRNRRTAAVPLVVEFIKNIDFQRRDDHFSETPV